MTSSNFPKTCRKNKRTTKSIRKRKRRLWRRSLAIRSFRGQHLKTAQKLRNQHNKDRDDTGSNALADQLEFEFVLFASAIIDYDYIMGLITKFASQAPGKAKMSREALVALIRGQSNLMDDSQDIVAYVDSLKEVKGISEADIRDGYARFQAQKNSKELAAIATRHGLAHDAVQTFVDGILDRMIFDGDRLTDLFASRDLGFKDRVGAELALMKDLHPVFIKRAAGRDISGLSAYDQ
jgi:type I restriction enzyme, R subunit